MENYQRTLQCNNNKKKYICHMKREQKRTPPMGVIKQSKHRQKLYNIETERCVTSIKFLCIAFCVFHSF